jgi:hypothetical protein
VGDVIRLRSSVCRLLWTATLLLGAGCEWLPLPQAIEGLAPIEHVPITFAAPEMITVKAGDTLALLAKRHATTVADLKSWNGLQSDTIEVGQVLLVWRLPEPQVAVARRTTNQSMSLESVMGGRDPLPVPGTPPLKQPSTPAPGPPAPVVAAAETAPIEQPAPPGPRVSIQRPALLAMLGVQVESDTDLAEAAANLQRHDVAAGNQMEMGDRALGTSNSVDTLELQRPEMRNLGPQIPDVPVSAPRLSKPPPKTCIRGAATVVAENGMTRSVGLSASQINAAMGQISKYTVRCFPPGTAGTYEVIVEIKVGCDGRVSNVFLINGGVVPTRVTSCIQQTLGYASFPAHGLPDGASFQYPMKFRF